MGKMQFYTRQIDRKKEKYKYSNVKEGILETVSRKSEIILQGHTATKRNWMPFCYPYTDISRSIERK